MAANPSSVPLEEAPWLARAWDRFRPTTGWAIFLLALSSAELLPFALIYGEIIPGVAPATGLAAGGFLMGWFLARRKVRGAAAAAGMAAAGAVASLTWGVNVLRPGLLLQQLWGRLSWLLSGSTAAEPPIGYFRDQWSFLWGYLQRTAWWIKGVAVGPGAPDNLVVIGLVVFLVWCTSAWAAWWIARHGKPFAAVLPAASLLAQHAYWAPSTLGYVLLMIGLLAFLLVLSPLVARFRSWDAEGVDYAEDIRLDGLFIALALACSVTILSPALPFLTSNEFSQRFWRVFESPLRRVEEQISGSFEVRQPVRSLVPPTGAAPGGLPRAHLLGGSPELGQALALEVRLRGDASGILLYWRGQTYATYTGRGWENRQEDLAERDFAAGQEWDRAAMPTGGRRPIVTTVEAFEASRTVLYGLGEPVSVDRPYTSIVRAPGELVALAHPDESRTYAVLSHAAVLDPAMLRSTAAGYPPEVASLYLQLPQALDPRLAAQLAEWTEGAASPFDVATGIERGLRALPYSLDVPTPPEARELVSWFLFDLKAGYCDYYATAMVVLARLAGIPARLAIGYATGAYDQARGIYSVKEANAHSWPELYFAGVGWVPFEPTAALPLPVRPEGLAPRPAVPAFSGGPEDLAEGVAQLRESAIENERLETRQARLRFGWTAAMALVLVSTIAATAASRSLPAASGAVMDAYGRFLAGGARLGRRIGGGETPREYARALAAVAAGTAERASWRRRNALAAAEIVRRDGLELVSDVERSLFAPAGQSAEVATRRPRLPKALRELWVVQRVARLKVRF